MVGSLRKMRKEKKMRKRRGEYLPHYGVDDLPLLIDRVIGDIDPRKLSAFIPVKNEMAFLPAFLAHYRKLGFEQFLFFDDRSNDGTLEFLLTQSDCVVIQAKKTFGEQLYFTGRTPNKNRVMRFGVYSKIAIPQFFLPGKIVAYFDADEFLILPPGVEHISEVYARIEELGSTGAYASMVEFFPRSAKSFEDPLPTSFEGMIEAYGWFEPEAMFDPAAPLDETHKPQFLAPSKSTRLFEQYGVGDEPERNSIKDLFLSERVRKQQGFKRSGRHTTPILYRSDESALFSCHDALIPPSGEIMLTLAHFVFTSNFEQKIKNARAWKAHVFVASKYKYYDALLNAVEGVEDGFLSERSERYENAQRLIECGLMKW